MISRQLKYLISAAVLMTTLNATDEMQVDGGQEGLRNVVDVELAEREALEKQLKLWAEPRPLSSPLDVDIQNPNGNIWEAFYGIKTAPLVDGNFVISDGATVLVRLEDRVRVIEGQLVGVSAWRTNLIVSDNAPHDEYPDDSAPSSWEELQKDMQFHQRWTQKQDAGKRGEISLLHRDHGMVRFDYSLGNLWDDKWSCRYMITVRPTDYVDFSPGHWGNGVNAIASGTSEVVVEINSPMTLRNLWGSLRPKVLTPSVPQTQGDQSSPQKLLRLDEPARVTIMSANQLLAQGTFPKTLFRLEEPFRVVAMCGNVLLAQGNLIALTGTSAFQNSVFVSNNKGFSGSLQGYWVDKKEEIPISSLNSFVSEVLYPCAQSEYTVSNFSVENVNGLYQVAMVFKGFRTLNSDRKIDRTVTLIIRDEASA